ncbi:hypothetical protein C9439_00795, partial [archaeon SCG-AAA382B04]
FEQNHPLSHQLFYDNPKHSYDYSRNQTILQKRWDLATIILDTAGQPKLSKNPYAGDIDSSNSKEMINEVQDRFRNSLIRAN